MGTSPQQIERLEKGGRKLTQQWIDKAAAAFGVSPAQIISPLDGSPPIEAKPLDQPTVEDFAAEHGIVFLEEMDLALGMGATYLDGTADVRGIVPFKEEWLNGLFSGSLQHLKVVRGRGDSMQPTIMDGDLVIIDTGHRRIDDQDRIWALSYGDLGMIRRIRVTTRGSWMLMPDNAVVRPDEVGDGEASIMGRVIWIGRRI
jgi:phage repressor protein C with HTH and peptisase S24 domain